MPRHLATLTVSLCLLLGLSSAFASTSPQFSLTIHDHAFQPQTLTVPAGVRIELRVKNARTLPSEFESGELNCEKVVPGGTTVSVWIGPLKPGKYKFFDDFNTGVSGWVVAKNQEAKS